MNRTVKIISLLVLLALFSACEKDLKSDGNIVVDGNILMTVILPNPSGQTGSSYMQIIDGVKPNTYNNTSALPIDYGVPPIIYGNEIYIIPGWANASNHLVKYIRKNGKIFKVGSLLLPSQSGANALVIHGNKAYISLSDIGKLLVVDYKNMKIISEIDITKYGVGDQNPDPSQMIIRDNLLYVCLSQLIANKMSSPTRKKSDVLIIDTKTDKPIKMITEEISGFSMPSKPESDSFSFFMDEKKDIYINCVSGFGMLRQKSGFIRIKNGETEFDKSYQFDITSTKIEGEKEKVDYLINVQYKSNGILYATGNCNAYYSKPADYAKDRSVLSMEIDLYAKTIKKLPVPNSNNYSASVSLYKGLVVFGLATSKDKGFYIYNPATGKASPEAVIKVQGFPYFLRLYEKK